MGNLAAGGTGKTPAVAWVVEVLKRAGRKPAILSRGYGGDETRLLRQSAPVIEEPDRVKGAQTAVAEGANVLVMDDGFQHPRLARDLDLVLIDATDPWGGGHLLPWGLLREPKEALGRAGAVLLTRSDHASPETLEGLRGEVSRLAPKALLAEAMHAPQGGAGWSGKRVLGVCGIGNPSAFRKTLEGLGARVEAFHAFRDHHAYQAFEVEALNVAARGLDDVVTTEKDWVKLEAFPEAAAWKVLKVRMALLKGGEALEQLIRTTVSSMNAEEVLG